MAYNFDKMTTGTADPGERKAPSSAPKRITERVVIIEATEMACLVSISESHGVGGSGGMLMQNYPYVAESIHDAVSYCRTNLSGDFSSLPENLRDSTEEERETRRVSGRRVIVRTARNGYTVEPAFKRSTERGWNHAQGDVRVFHDPTLTLKFCSDYLHDRPGTYWWDWRP